MSEDDIQQQPEAVPVPPRLGELLELVDELVLAVEGARTVPLSNNVMLDRAQLIDMLYRLRDELPDELRAAVDDLSGRVGRLSDRLDEVQR